MVSREDFLDEINSIAAEMDVLPKEVHIREMKRKIASCSSKGRLTFAPSVLEMDRKERYGIVIHELLHLRYHTHTKMFNTLVEAYTERICEMMRNDRA